MFEMVLFEIMIDLVFFVLVIFFVEGFGICFELGVVEMLC